MHEVDRFSQRAVYGEITNLNFGWIAFNNILLLVWFMGLSMGVVNRLLLGSLLITAIVAFTTQNAMQTVWAAIGLTSLTGFVWIISSKEQTFDYLGLNSGGLLNAFFFIISVVAFSEFCFSLWDSPFVGTYILSIATVGTFWWTIDMLQPSTV